MVKGEFSYTDPLGLIKFTFARLPVAFWSTEPWLPRPLVGSRLLTLSDVTDLNSFDVCPLSDGKVAAGNWDVAPRHFQFACAVLAEPLNTDIAAFEKELGRWSSAWAQSFITKTDGARSAAVEPGWFDSAGAVEDMTAHYHPKNPGRDEQIIPAQIKTFCRWNTLRDGRDIRDKEAAAPFEKHDTMKAEKQLKEATEPSLLGKDTWCCVDKETRTEVSKDTVRVSVPAYRPDDHPPRVFPLECEHFNLNGTRLESIKGNEHFVTHLVLYRKPSDQAEPSRQTADDGGTEASQNEACLVPIARLNWAVRHDWSFKTYEGTSLAIAVNENDRSRITVWPERKSDGHNWTELHVPKSPATCYYGYPTNPDVHSFPDIREGASTRDQLYYLASSDRTLVFRHTEAEDKDTIYRQILVKETEKAATLPQPNPLQPLPPLRFGLEFEFKLRVRDDVLRQRIEKMQERPELVALDVTEHKQLASPKDRFANRVHRLLAEYLAGKWKTIPGCMAQFVEDVDANEDSGPDSPDLDYTKWSIVRDPALRLTYDEVKDNIFSFEFVGPLTDYNVYSRESMYHAFALLQDLFTFVETYFTILAFADKTSTHVNVSPRAGWTLEQVKQVACAAYFWDPHIRYVVPPHRRVRTWARDLRTSNFGFRRPRRATGFKDNYFPQTKLEWVANADHYLKCTWEDVWENLGDLENAATVEELRGRFDPREHKETGWNLTTMTDAHMRKRKSGCRIEFRRPPSCLTKWEAVAWLDFTMAFTYAALDKDGGGGSVKALKKLETKSRNPAGLGMRAFQDWIARFRMLPRTKVGEFLNVKFERAENEVLVRSGKQPKIELRKVVGDETIVSQTGGLYLTSKEEAMVESAREAAKDKIKEGDPVPIGVIDVDSDTDEGTVSNDAPRVTTTILPEDAITQWQACMSLEGRLAKKAKLEAVKAIKELEEWIVKETELKKAAGELPT